MIKLTKLAIVCVMLVVFAANNVTLDAQTKVAATKSASISVSVSLQKDTFATNEKPLAILTLKNVSNRIVSVRTDMVDYRVHVERDTREAPRTSYHRRIRGELLPGETGLAAGGAVDSVPPGGSDTRKYDLSAFYDLAAPGKYALYMEVLDEPSGIWLRTNTVEFTMQAPSQ